MAAIQDDGQSISGRIENTIRTEPEEMNRQKMLFEDLSIYLEGGSIATEVQWVCLNYTNYWELLYIPCPAFPSLLGSLRAAPRASMTGCGDRLGFNVLVVLVRTRITTMWCATLPFWFQKVGSMHLILTARPTSVFAARTALCLSFGGVAFPLKSLYPFPV